LEQSASGQGGLGILTGPAGSGKSFLTRHLEIEARQRGFSTGHGRFERHGRSRMPWPWPQVLRGLGGKETTQLARELMQEALAAPLEEREGLLGSSGMGAGRLVIPLVDALDAHTGSGPLLLIFDDLQDCDAASAEVLLLVAEALTSLPCLILLVMQQQSADSSSLESRSITDTFLSTAAHRICTLPPLAEEETLAILGEEICLALGGPRSAHELTRGNPLLATAVRQAALPTATLTSTLSTPERALHAIAAHRREELSREQQDLVSALAIRPEGSDSSLLANILECELTDLEKIQRSSALEGLIEVESGRGNVLYQISTESMRAAFLNAIAPEERRALHLRHAEALIERTRQGFSVPSAQVADHALEASPIFPPADAAHWTWRSAQEANAAEAFGNAARMISDGLRTLALGDVGAHPELHRNLLLEGIAATSVLEPQVAREYLRELRQLAEALPSGERRLVVEEAVDATNPRVQNLALLEDLRQFLQLALDELAPNDPAEVGLIARQAAILHRIPDPEARHACDTLSEEALAKSAVPEVSRELRAIARATHLLCNTHARIPEERLKMARDLSAYAIEEQQPNLRLIADCTLVIDALAAGRASEAETAIDRLSQEAASASHHPVSWYPFHLRAMRAGMRADFKAARRWLEVGVENASPATYTEATAAAWLLLTQLANMSGISIFHVPVLPYLQLPALPQELENADFQIEPLPAEGHPLIEPWSEVVAEIAEASRHAPQLQPGGGSRAPIGASPDLSAHWRVGYAGVLSRLLNDRDGARAIVEDMARQKFAEIPRDAQWLASLCLAAQTCNEVESTQAAGPALETLLPFTNQNAVTAMGLVFSGPVAGFAAPLARLIGDYEQADTLSATAIAASDQVGAVFAGAQARLERALILVERKASADRAEAENLFQTAQTTIATFKLNGLLPHAARVAELLAKALPAAPAETLTSGPAVPPSSGQALEATSASQASAAPATEAVFVCEGDSWRIGWEGQEIRLRQQRGLAFIASLLGRPHEEVHARMLMTPDAAPGADAATQADLATGNLSIADDGGLEVLDEQALQAFRSRFAQARGELAEAEADNDLGRVEILQREIDFLTQELTGATGLHGRKRRTGSDNERARVAVRKRVKASLDRIRRDMPGLHAHLSASIRTGSVCRYAPESPVEWQTN
jgi:hypothetical protein